VLSERVTTLLESRSGIATQKITAFQQKYFKINRYHVDDKQRGIYKVKKQINVILKYVNIITVFKNIENNIIF
jgi:hypothetical protein